VKAGVLEHERIKTAAVVPVPDPLRGEEVKLYVILKDGETPETLPPSEIVEFAARKLARFKLPRYIEYADHFPLTPSERVAKHELIRGRADLRTNSFDVVDGVWR
jgi:crotonobetaine/carnitine-CoA ligase